MFLDEEFLNEYDDSWNSGREMTMAESVNQFLNEGASEWFGFYFKGTSDETLERIKTQMDEQITSQEQANDLLETIDETLTKVKNRGDKSHTIGNILQVLLVPGAGLGLLAKHLIKVYGYEDARKEAIKLLKQHKIALVKIMQDKKWD